MTEVREQRTEVREQKTEDRGQKAVTADSHSPKRLRRDRSVFQIDFFNEANQ